MADDDGALVHLLNEALGDPVSFCYSVQRLKEEEARAAVASLILTLRSLLDEGIVSKEQLKVAAMLAAIRLVAPDN